MSSVNPMPGESGPARGRSQGAGDRKDVDEARVLVRSATTSTGPVTGNGRETRWLKEPEDFVVVKGPGFR